MSEDGPLQRPPRRRVLWLPLLGLLAFAAFFWNVRHWPRQRDGGWPPGVNQPAASLAGNVIERRALAWAFREADGWRFEISPRAGADDAAVCTVNVLIDHGSYGWPYPVEVGWWSTRAVMNLRRPLDAAELPALYAAAADFLESHPQAPETAFAPGLREPGLTEMHPVPYATARNFGAVVLAVLGSGGGLWFGLAAAARIAGGLRAARVRRRAASALAAQMCPACGYDWRGLPERRCPECGFRGAAPPPA